jgi:hypothetical protein
MTNVNLAGTSISKSRLDGFMIDGILVTHLLAAYAAQQQAAKGTT